MPLSRKYDDGCAASHALDLVGERWGLLIVRELLFGPKRFTDIRAGVQGASSSVLSQRLREFEESGVVHRRQLGPPSGAVVYELSSWGYELEPVVLTLGRWGCRSPAMRHDAEPSIDSLMLALRTLFDTEAAEGITATLAVRVGNDAFRIRIADRGLLVARGTADRPDAVLTTDTATLNALIWSDADLDDAMDRGAAALTGDRQSVDRFLGLFPLPETASVG